VVDKSSLRKELWNIFGTYCTTTKMYKNFIEGGDQQYPKNITAKHIISETHSTRIDESKQSSSGSEWIAIR
jgi:hypothetical protein